MRSSRQRRTNSRGIPFRQLLRTQTPRARSNEGESGRQERSSALCPHRGALIHLPAGETGLAELSLICWTLLRWRSTDINAIQFADRLFQGSPVADLPQTLRSIHG